MRRRDRMRLRGAIGVLWLVLFAGCADDADRLADLRSEESLLTLDLLARQHRFDSLAATITSDTSAATTSARIAALDSLKQTEARLDIVRRDIGRITQ